MGNSFLAPKTCSAAALTVLAIWAVAGLSWGVTIDLISQSSAGERANRDSRNPAMTPDARYVAFGSDATNLVPGYADYGAAVFLRDRMSGTTQPVSVGWSGEPADRSCLDPAVSDDGRFVTFLSYASNLAPQGNNGFIQVFLRDVVGGTTEAISVTDAGELADDNCGYAAVSADGRYVFFTSYASNLVVPAPPSGTMIYVRDRADGTMHIASLGLDGQPWSVTEDRFAITPDSRFIVFVSGDVFLRDRVQGATELISMAAAGGPGGWSFPASITTDGRYVAFASNASELVLGDTNGCRDVFARDRLLGVTDRVSVSSSGEQGNNMSGSSGQPPAISDDGRFVAFLTSATNLIPLGGTGLYLRDRVAGITQLVRGPHGQATAAGDPAISADGRYIAFASRWGDLVPGDSGWYDIFLLDRLSFEDVPLDHWAFYEVGACNMAGIVQGYPDGLYRPDVTVTRDQMAVYIARALSGGAVPTGPAEATFPDVPTDHWAYDEIEYAVATHVVEGYGDGTYQPSWEVTRAQMAVFVARSVVSPTGEDGLATYTPPAAATFPDVPTWYWSYKHVEYLAEHNVVSGYPDGTYQPTQYVSRDQMAVYVQRAFHLPL
jgi:Tol biopolymer transport system component